jgi:hypothetical protein
MAVLLEALKRAANPRPWRRPAIWIAAAGLVAAATLGTVRTRARVAHVTPAAPAPCGALGDEGDVYVEADASREEVGTAACPFRTITAAITAAQRRSAVHAQAIHVGPGEYTAAHGEAFPLVLRGVALFGAGAERTTIEGTGALDSAASGGVLDRKEGQLTHVTVVVGDERAPTVLSGVTVRPGMARRSDYMGIVCDRGTTPAEGAVGAPNTILDGVVVGPDYDDAVVAGTSTRPQPTGCNMLLRSTVVDFSGTGVWVLGCGTGDGRVPVAVEVGDGTEAHRNVFKNSDPPRGIGVAVWDCVAAVTVNGNLFESGSIGVSVVRHPNRPPQMVTIQRNTFRAQSRAGVLALKAASIALLEDNIFTGISAPGPDAFAAGVWLDAEGQPLPPAVWRARRNLFAGNDNGVLANGAKLRGPGAPPRALLIDFGTDGDEGNNEFQCNSRSAQHPGFDVLLDVPGAAARASFVGNAWDHYPPMVTTMPPGRAPDGADVVFPGAGVAPSGDRVDPSAHGDPPTYGGRCMEGRVPGTPFPGR